jgi:hypothetical protein
MSAVDFTPSPETVAEWGPRPVPPDWDWPEVKGIFVHGCVERGIGSSFRHQAHAHTSTRDPNYHWICVRSHRRLYAMRRDDLTGLWVPTDRPSRLMWHEYAHVLTDAGHDDRWRGKMQELGQPIPKQYKKRKRTT